MAKYIVRVQQQYEYIFEIPIIANTREEAYTKALHQSSWTTFSVEDTQYDADVNFHPSIIDIVEVKTFDFELII